MFNRTVKKALRQSSLLVATLMVFSPVHASESDQQLYQSVFSGPSIGDGASVPEGQQLSYAQYESCFRTYKSLIEFNLDHGSTQQTLIDRQNAMYTEQENLALMRKEINDTQNPRERVRLANEYDVKAVKFNEKQEALNAALTEFSPIINGYRVDYNEYNRQCSEMYYNEDYMARLPESLKAEYRVLIETASGQ
jgi:hypothetical protein